MPTDGPPVLARLFGLLVYAVLIATLASEGIGQRKHYDRAPTAVLGSETTLFFSLPPEKEVGMQVCVADLRKSVAPPSGEYQERLLRAVCEWSWGRDLDPLLVSAVIWTESRWKDVGCGPFGCGAMQVIGMHARRWNIPRESLTDPWTNVKIGTEVLLLHEMDLQDYNGHCNKNYTTVVMKRLRRYRKRLGDVASPHYKWNWERNAGKVQSDDGSLQ